MVKNIVDAYRTVFEKFDGTIFKMVWFMVSFMFLSSGVRFILRVLRDDFPEHDYSFIKDIGKAILQAIKKAFRWLKRLCNSYYVEEIGENGKLVRRYYDSYEEAMKGMSKDIREEDFNENSSDFK